MVRHVRRKLIASKVLSPRKERDFLNWAIIGTGYMASVWADLLLDSKEGTILCVCSRTQDKASAFARQFGSVAAFGDIDEMLRAHSEELDFIYVATPLAVHAPIIRKCIEAGVNVLTEKPATESASEWAALVDLARARGVLLVEGMWMRCLPTFRRADEWIAQNKIGTVQWIKADLSKFQLPHGPPVQQADGALMDYGTYPLYFACHFLGGSPEWLQGHVRRNANGDDADWSIVAGRSGKTAVINISSNWHGANRAAVIGDRGVIEWGEPFNRTGEISLYNYQSGRQESQNFRYRNQGFEYQLAEVTRSLRMRASESAILSHKATLDTLRFAERVQAEATEVLSFSP
jgi:predicted dehydrogenase